MELVDEIRKVFPDEPLPEKICESVIDRETEEYEDAFKGKRWTEIDVHFIFPQNYPALNFFTAKARAYYLPAWMVAALKDFDALDVGFDMLLSTLFYDKNDHRFRYWFLELVEYFNEPQRKLIARFLMHVMTVLPEEECYGDEIEKVYNSFWRQYE